MSAKAAHGKTAARKKPGLRDAERDASPRKRGRKGAKDRDDVSARGDRSQSGRRDKDADARHRALKAHEAQEMARALDQERWKSNIVHQLMLKLAPDFWHQHAEVVIVHFNIFLYSACFWISQNIIPYLTKELNASTVTFGYLQSTYAVVQLLGGPLFGRFGDLYGSRAALVLSFLSAALSYGLLGLANSVSLLFISRLPSIFMHAMQGGQMAVTDLAVDGKRVAALGQLSLSYGVGMMVGPLIGGLMSTQMGLQTAAFVACAGSLVSAVLCQFFLPRRTKLNRKEDDDTAHDATILNVFLPWRYYEIIKFPRVLGLLFVRFVTGIPIGIFQSMFAVVAIEMYGLSAQENGAIMSYTALLATLVQGGVMPWLSRRFGDVRIIKIGVVVLTAAYFLLMFVRGVVLLCIVLIPLVFGLSVVTIVIGATLTHTVPDADTGTVLGMNMAINALIRTVSPTLGAWLVSNYGFSSFGWLGFIASISMYAFLETKYPMDTIRFQAQSKERENTKGGRGDRESSSDEE